ncbi:MAG: type II toxin-antitoxin system PemK/MazF family toxin [Gammaproteobacteria bacterium]|nr:type II toxin-antitoxin system PemK/MazF family toxin [Gammaproteobacteria bacterium]
MRRGEIWLVSLDPAAGHEQQGTRLVVIVSPAKFNELTRTPIVLPITTGGRFARRRGFAVSLADAGTRTVGFIRCDQPRALDLESRNGRRLEVVPEPLMDEVIGRVAAIMAWEPAP